jgi:hypothetical protein
VKRDHQQTDFRETLASLKVLKNNSDTEFYTNPADSLVINMRSDMDRQAGMSSTQGVLYFAL